MKNKKKHFIPLILGTLFSAFSVVALCNNATVETHAQSAETVVFSLNRDAPNTYSYTLSNSLDYVESYYICHESITFDNSNPNYETCVFNFNCPVFFRVSAYPPWLSLGSQEYRVFSYMSGNVYLNTYYELYTTTSETEIVIYNSLWGTPDFEEFGNFSFDVDIVLIPTNITQNFGYDWGYALGDNDGYFRGYEFGFEQGEFYWKGQLGNDIENAYNNGYRKGLEDTQADIFNEGKKEGYRYGYDDGFTKAEESTKELYSLMSGIMDAPINAIKNVLNFEILGVNVSGAIFGILSLIIVAFVIKRVV